MSRAVPRPGHAESPHPAGRAGWRYFLVFWVPVLVYLAVIFVGSSIPKLPDIPGGFSDKTAHAGEYAVLGLLLARALAGRDWSSVGVVHVGGAVVLATLYGMSDEYHQLFVPGRQFDVADMMADAIGASAGAGALWAWGIIRRFWAVSANQS